MILSKSHCFRTMLTEKECIK